MSNLKVGTMFSGIGAPEVALNNLKIPHNIKWACDIDKYAKKTYLANHSCEKWYDDITKIDIESLEYIDLFVFGFPCQSLSNAGKRDLSDGRSLLVKYCLDILDKKMPKYFIFENVAALLQNNFKDFFNYIVERVSKNYQINYKVLNTKHFGLPQNRDRVFCVGIRKDIGTTFNFDNIPKLEVPKLRDFLDDNVDTKYYINDDKLKTFTPSNRQFKSDKIFVGGLRYGKLRGDRREGIMTNYGQIKQVFSIEGISVTLCLSADIGKYMMDDGRIRILTPNEFRKLQGFPNDFKLPISNNQIYKRFGNTISIPVIQAILNELLQ